MSDEEESVQDVDEKQSNNDEPDNNIKIFLRIKPTKKPSGYFDWEDNENLMNYNIPKDVASGLINNSRTKYKFKFDALIGMDATQEEVFDDVGKPCVLNAMKGFNSTIFAYGQTGSGKTFTITGGAAKYADRGIIPRSLSLIFTEMKDNPASQITAYISYLEIYNNQGYDLLDPNHQTTNSLDDLPKVQMLEDEDGNCHLRNLSMHRVNSEEDALNLLFLGDTNRAVSETAMNLASSRSHCIFTVSLELRKAGSEVILRSKLHLVDLAGSERAHKTGAKGQVLREAMFINTSLHYLEMVIVALHEKNTKGRGHIPYRNSMMTSVLRDSLGGNCKTAMIATVSAEKSQTDESLSTCRFAQRVARVRNDARLNEEVDPAIIIRRLKAEIITLKEEISILKGETDEGDELKEREKKILYQKILDYVDDLDPNSVLALGNLTYTKIRSCFEYFKEMVLEARKSGGSNQDDNSNTQLMHQTKNTPATDEVLHLRNLIQQRDNEIAIMVKMVKQGEGNTGAIPTEILNVASKQFNNSNLASGSQSANKFNVDIDPETLKDPAKSFQEFKKQYPMNHVIQNNKMELKQKYDEAQELGKSVNESRNEIKKQKKLIEKIRTEQLINQDGNDEHKGNDEVIESPAEGKAKRIIDQEKQNYKDGFEKLRNLKTEIQHIQKLLEKNRIQLQKDFDQWYQSKGYGPAHDIRASMSSNQSKEHLKESAEGPEINTPPTSKKAWGTPPNSADAKRTNNEPLTGMKDVDDDVAAFKKTIELMKRRKSQKQ